MLTFYGMLRYSIEYLAFLAVYKKIPFHLIQFAKEEFIEGLGIL